MGTPKIYPTKFPAEIVAGTPKNTPPKMLSAGTPKIGFMVLSRQYSDEERERHINRGRAAYFPVRKRSR